MGRETHATPQVRPAVSRLPANLIPPSEENAFRAKNRMKFRDLAPIEKASQRCDVRSAGQPTKTTTKAVVTGSDP
jgi:hypothetical protein